MANKTFVLLEIEIGKKNDILVKLGKIPGLRALDTVSGPYDIIATFEMEDINTLLKTIVERIHLIEGIRRVVSCISLHQNKGRTVFASSTLEETPVHRNVGVAVGCG